MKEYDIFVPLYYKDGTPVETARFQHLQALLLERFEGLTYFPQPNQGFWKFGNMTYRDEDRDLSGHQPEPNRCPRLPGYFEAAFEKAVPARGSPDHRA